MKSTLLLPLFFLLSINISIAGMFNDGADPLFEPLIYSSTCDEAVTAVEGVNTVSTENNRFWYKYTMPIDGKLHISTEVDLMVDVFMGTCDGYWQIGGGSNDVLFTDLKENDNIFIHWFTYEEKQFDWNLSASPILEGDICEMPKEAILGTNSLSAPQNKEFWYSFTMPEDGNLLITSNTSSFISINQPDCDYGWQIQADVQNVSTADLKAGMKFI